MTGSGSSHRVTPLAEPRFRLLVWLVLGVVGWAGFAVLVAAGLSTTPPTAGFDLELVLEAGRRVAAGQSPYDPAALRAGSAEAQDLFYSYPPPVAQAASLITGVPTGVVLLGLLVLAVGGLAAVATALSRVLVPGRPAGEAAIAVVAISPFVFPFAVALLFGNLDATFPLLYGLLVLTAVAPSDAPAAGRRWAVAGVGVALASLKLHPASLGLWLLARGARERGPRIALAVATTTGLAIVAVSLVVGGVGAWRDYLDQLAAASGADLIDRRNIGPASQVALALGLDEAAARTVAIAATLVAVAGTVIAAVRVRDPLMSVAWGSTASLVTLPVTWFHYPAALVPLAAAIVIRDGEDVASRRTLGLVIVAILVGLLAIALPALAWVGVGLVILAIGLGRQ